MHAGIAYWARLSAFGRGTITAEKLGLSAKWLKKRDAGRLKAKRPKGYKIGKYYKEV